MSNRSPEDEMIAQARQFSSSMQAAMRHYAQASNWLERRRARREISLITRQEAREQQAARQRHLVYSEQAVDKYRVHALAVSQRANDPSVDHGRRFRDQQVLARHQADMRDLVLRNPHLTEVEKGIALDGLDAATAFPEFETGKLFNRAHKVKGIEALRYRAQVARARRDAEAERSQVRERAERLSTITEQARPVQGGPGQQFQVKATVSRWSPGMPTLEQDRLFVGEQDAIDWLHRDISESRWAPDARVGVEVVDLADVREPIYSDEGRPSTVAATLKARSNELREQARERHQDRSDHTPFGDPDLNGQPARSTGRDRQDLAAERDSLKARLNLSIEHNSELADNNAQLTRQLTAVTAERDQLRAEYARDTADDARLEAERSQLRETNSRLTAKLDQALAERDQLRAERDAAVRKVAERTPAEQRYGSPERQAEQARQTAVRDKVRRAGSSAEKETASQAPTGEAGSFYISNSDGRLYLDEFLPKGAGMREAVALRDELAEATSHNNSKVVARQIESIDPNLPMGEQAKALAHWWTHQNGREAYQTEQAQQRAAQQATGTESASEAAPRSPLADYQPGHGLADAVARNGHDREGMDR
ncbi:hypothetical protein [Nocardia sp. CA-135398]|uniref:hypothetical protein n=1 Tax=Nocardia sp. CA-135398 TaxID=3239977 RepID=UPI003D99084C